MVNAGAIATTGLIRGADIEERTSRIVEMLSAFAGRSLWIDEAVYASESATGDRNRALAYLMRSHGIDRVAGRAVGRDLLPAVLGAGHGTRSRDDGRHARVRRREPGDRASEWSDERVARDVISLMSSCGMYDFSGEWMLRVGLPAKSGVRGRDPRRRPVAVRGGGVQPEAGWARQHRPRQRDRERPVRRNSGCICSSRTRTSRSPRSRSSHTAEGRVIRLGGELGFAGAEQVLAVLSELAASAPPGAEVLLDVRALARTHPAALVALRTQFDLAAPGFRILE